MKVHVIRNEIFFQLWLFGKCCTYCKLFVSILNIFIAEIINSKNLEGSDNLEGQINSNVVGLIRPQPSGERVN